ncbi:MAG TPA: glycosyltransferase family 8 protein [Afipia sp.]
MTASASSGRIDIALGFDERYAPHAAATVQSILAATPGADFRFTIIHDGLSSERRNGIELTAPKSTFHWVQIGDADIPAYASREHFSRAILFRLGLADAAPSDCDRMLYVDTDVICTRDIRDLWVTDMGGAPIAAVQDCFVKPDEFAKRWDLDPAAPSYFNSGILLIDMNRARSEGAFKHAIDFVARHAAEVRFADQDALNFAFWGRWKKLDIVWNAQRHMAIPALIADLAPDMRLNGRQPAIIHFTGPEKPWTPNTYHPWSWLYWRAVRKTVFAAEVSRASGVGHLARARLLARWLRSRFL